ncbi:MAG: hypothetical protein ACYDD0_03655 [Candidatus Dormibacteria bacterium]
MKVDHLLLIESTEYLEVTADRIAGSKAGRAANLTVVHEADGSCCRREPWLVTLGRVLSAANRRRGLTSLLVVP